MGAKAALSAALLEARQANVDDAEIAQVIACRQQVAEACLKGVLEATEDIDMRSIAALRDAKELLRKAIADATEHGVTEAGLVEAEHRRRRYHNKIEDLKGSIRVFCRVRPLGQREIELGDEGVIRNVDSMTLEIDTCKNGFSARHGDTETRQFTFDSVFTPASQQEVFQDCSDLLQSAHDGYNVTVFAYGQTGSGKTHTISGRPDQPGLAPQMIDEIFRLVERDSVRFDTKVSASMLELYRNDLYDLLQPGSGSEALGKVSIRTDRDGAVQYENVCEEECVDAKSLAALLERGTLLRRTAATAMNTESSRSHLILTVKVLRTNRETGAETKGKIQLIDLAGSERLKKSQVSGDVQKDTIEINKSLTALGDVIEALTQGATAVPYRNHKLTQILQDSLGRTAKTLMFVHCAPGKRNVEETMATLKYASRAKKITNHASPRCSVVEATPSLTTSCPPPAPLQAAFPEPPVAASVNGYSGSL